MTRKKEVWEMNLEERLRRVLKRIPATVNMNDKIVKTVSDIPYQNREHIRDFLIVLIYRLKRQLYWWERVLAELDKKPSIKVVKFDEEHH